MLYSWLIHKIACLKHQRPLLSLLFFKYINISYRHFFTYKINILSYSQPRWVYFIHRLKLKWNWQQSNILLYLYIIIYTFISIILIDIQINRVSFVVCTTIPKVKKKQSVNVLEVQTWILSLNPFYLFNFIYCKCFFNIEIRHILYFIRHISYMYFICM